MYISILFVALPALVIIPAFVFVISRLSGRISGDKKEIGMKTNELAEKLKKGKGRTTEDR
jgi:hypothetical protein